MAIFQGFNGMMPTPEKVAQVAAVPYDVVNSEEAAELAKGNPLSFLGSPVRRSSWNRALIFTATRSTPKPSRISNGSSARRRWSRTRKRISMSIR